MRQSSTKNTPSIEEHNLNKLAPVDRLLSVKDCASILNCHPATIWRMVKSAQFPKPIKLGNLTRWSESEVQQLLVRSLEPGA